jgi:putative NIF3 family GTP cyclohydrolase 1 type 2
VTTVADVTALLDSWYEPAWAESWDAVGLALGDPAAAVGAIHVALDPTEAVAVETVGVQADLLLTHHPLYLGGTTSLSTGPKGRVVRTLAGRALFVAHTNADVARPGVSDALADRLGLTELSPLQPGHDRLDRWVVHVPVTHTAAVLDAMADAGAGTLGAYDRCAFTTSGEGTFRPQTGASPFRGEVGAVERVAEHRLELVAAPHLRRAIAAAVRVAHPYEVPSVSVVDVFAPSDRGMGRVGLLPRTMSLEALCALVGERLPATASGIRASGDPDAPVRTVAVAGGACLDLAGVAHAAGADVLVTSDAKHHRTQEAPLPIVDVAHWAGEWPWTAAVGARLAEALPGCRVSVSDLVTDPWTVQVGGRAGSAE